MPTPPPLPVELSISPFTTAEALVGGVPYARLRRRDLYAPFRGIRDRTPPTSQADRCRAYAPRLANGHAFCRESAAALWGMWLPHRVERDETVSVLAIAPARAPRMRGVRGFRSSSADLALIAGLPLTSPADTWCQLGQILALDELIAAGDSLVRRNRPLCSIEELGSAAARRAGARGIATVRRALPHVRSGCDSPRETRLRLILHRARLPEPEINPVVSAPGERVRYGDIVFREWSVIVEYDGSHHFTNPKQYAVDIARHEELARAGWTVIRVLAAHFEDPASIVERVERALSDNGWRRRPSRGQLLRATSRTR